MLLTVREERQFTCKHVTQRGHGSTRGRRRGLIGFFFNPFCLLTSSQVSEIIQ